MTKKNEKPLTSIALFQEKTVRRVWHNEQWYFSVIDIISILTDSSRPRKYWSDLKVKLLAEGYIEVSEKIGQLKMQAPDGKLRETDAADSQTLLRIIQSIPSPKAEPFKRWLAEVGQQRLSVQISQRLQNFLNIHQLLLLLLHPLPEQRPVSIC
jgi:DNA-damage-inducible protein D